MKYYLRRHCQKYHFLKSFQIITIVYFRKKYIYKEIAQHCGLYLINYLSEDCDFETYIIMKFPLAYLFPNVIGKTSSNLLSTVPIINNTRDFSNNHSKQSKKTKKELPSRSVKTPLFKIPSPHDLGFHHVLKPLRPVITPIVDSFSKVSH